MPEDSTGILFRIGIHVGDVVEESDGDLMGDGASTSRRDLKGIARPGAICLSEDAYRQVRGRLDLAVTRFQRGQLLQSGDVIDERPASVSSRHTSIAGGPPIVLGERA